MHNGQRSYHDNVLGTVRVFYLMTTLKPRLSLATTHYAR